MFTAKELEEIRCNLNKLDRKGILVRPIILFGYSDNSLFLMDELEQRGHTVTGFIDNNPAVCGKLASVGSKLKVELAEHFLENYNSEYIFLIVSRFFTEMKKQLEAHGYTEGRNIFRLVLMEDVSLWQHIDEENFLKKREQVLKGYEIYSKLLEIYPKHCIMVNPVGSIGDVYLMGCYVKKFLEKKPDTIFIFSSNTMVKLAKDIGFCKVKYCSAEEIECILLYARIMGFDNQNIQLLHTGVLTYRIWSRLLTKLNYTWLSHYRELFDISPETAPLFPDISVECKERVQSFYEVNHLKKGKTVVLAPYANTIRNFPVAFWKTLTASLKASGYSVCTNVANEQEKPIEGTIPLIMGLNEMKEALEYAGYFIGIRSGLCDIVGNCGCKKFILYTKERFDFITVYEFYSLKKMGYRGEIYEYVIDIDEQQEIINDIVDKITEKNFQ